MPSPDPRLAYLQTLRVGLQINPPPLDSRAQTPFAGAWTIWDNLPKILRQAVLRWIKEVSALNPKTKIEVVMYGRGLDLVVSGKSIDGTRDESASLKEECMSSGPNPDRRNFLGGMLGVVAAASLPVAGTVTVAAQQSGPDDWIKEV